MARIPVIQQQFVPTFVQQPIENPMLTAVSKVAGDIGEIAAQQYNKQRQARDVTAVNDAVIEFEVKNLEDMDNFRKANSANPVGKTKEYDPILRDSLNAVSERMPTPSAKLAFNREAANIRLRSNVQLMNWEKTQEINNFKVSSDKTSDNLNTLAYRQANFDSLPQILKNVDATKISDSTFTGEAEAERMRLDRRKSTVANTFLGLIDKNVGQAEAVFNSKKYDGELGTEGVIQVKALIDQKKKSNMVMQDHLLSLKEKDPYKYAAAIGDTKGLQPIKVGGPDTSQSFIERQRYIERMRIQHGVNLPLLSDPEVEGINNNLANMDDNTATNYMSSLQSSIAPDQFVGVSKQLFKKNPALGVGLAIAGDDPAATRQIIKGNALIKNKAVAMPSDTDFTESFFKKLGNAIQQPELRSSSLEAVKAHYAAQTQDNGTATKDKFDNEAFDKSVEAVLGPIVTTGNNNAKTLSFRGTFGKNKQERFLDENEFESLVDDLTVDDIEKTAGYIPTALNGDPINLNAVKKRGELQAIGDGRYRIILNGEYVPNQKGDAPFELDLKKIQTRQKR